MSGLAASPLGFLIGVLIGAFGGGGSLIAIPILVYIVGQDVRAAQATALVIVVAAAAAGLIAHLRSDDVRWRMGIVFGLVAGVSALLGSLLNQHLDPNLLLLLFSPLMLIGGWAMASERARRPASFRPWRFGIGPGNLVGVVALGLLVGWLIGLFGVGGGFLIVPALVIVLGLSLVEAVGTSLLVIVIASSFALGERLASGDVSWGVAIPFALAALLGALAGRRLTQAIDTDHLRISFALLIGATAVYMAVRSALAL